MDGALDRDGFSGAISLPLLPDLIQVYTVSLADGALSIRSGERRGTIWFERGEIVHAECGGVTGAEAVYQLLRWQHGQFSLDANARAAVRTITVPWQNVLMEGCRLLDEDTAADPRLRIAHALRELEETLPGLRTVAMFDGDGDLVAQRMAAEGLDLAPAGALVVQMLRTRAQGARAPLVDCFSVLDDQEQLIVPLAGGGALHLLLARGAVNLAVVRRAVARALERLQ